MLEVGERAPEFTLPDDTGTDRSLTELLTTGAIILYFYPADFTPGCTRQACAMRDLNTEIQRAGLRIVGISPQNPKSHAKFREKYHLPYVLLSDEHKTVIKMYGLNGPLGIGVRRASYLIDGGRRVRDAVLADFLVGRHAAFGEQLIADTDKVGAADARHGDDVHGAVLIAADRRNTPYAAQRGDQGRHSIAVPHHENSTAGMFAENAARKGAGIVA
jgi:thioredoxin-dependent peroxiredoxin